MCVRWTAARPGEEGPHCSPSHLPCCARQVRGPSRRRPRCTTRFQRGKRSGGCTGLASSSARCGCTELANGTTDILSVIVRRLGQADSAAKAAAGPNWPPSWHTRRRSVRQPLSAGGVTGRCSARIQLLKDDLKETNIWMNVLGNVGHDVDRVREGRRQHATTEAAPPTRRHAGAHVGASNELQASCDTCWHTLWLAATRCAHQRASKSRRPEARSTAAAAAPRPGRGAGCRPVRRATSACGAGSAAG